MAGRVEKIMNSLRLVFEWQHQEGIRGAELQATWGALKIMLGNECLTRVFDHSARTIRSNIYVPLYPLAEWIVWNWWSILYEPEVHWLREQRNYSKRHNFRCVGDGIAMPDVEFLTLGEYVQVCWKPSDHSFQRIGFLGKGKALINRKELTHVLHDFVQSVCVRLDQENIAETWLQKGWDIVQKSMEDPEELSFCKAMAMQGKDPYTLKPDEEELFIRIADSLPDGVLDDFLFLTDWSKMREGAKWLQNDLDWISQQPGNWSTLKRIRKEISSPDAGQLPWNQGYELARYVRKKLGINGTRPPSSYEVIADWLDTPLDQLQKSMRFEAPLFAGLEAIVWENENRSPGFILKKKRRKENQIFSFCRALCDYFVFPHAPSLISGVNTERQKRNRAFAAEFLVPADAVRKAIHGREVSQEDMDEIAYDMGVSSYVIHHQVENHHLALVSTA